MIRRASEADIPFFIELGKLRYGDRASPHIEDGVRWLKWMMRNPSSIVLVGSASMGIASINMHYGVERRARLDLLAALPKKRATLEAYYMVKAMIRWATLNGCQGQFRIDADTGVNFGPFARRLGGREVDPKQFPRYIIPLDGGSL